ncbi:MAG: TetR/AcrR family transcriptional regulator [candidate division Zixibacteria bacterium]|nr:TetR/AcrR family transcriptional regulator [candidate division Zixibacteria bacterium]
MARDGTASTLRPARSYVETALMLDENVVVKLVARGVVADTFRRLSPEKKSQIYRAAIRLLGEYGYDGLSVDDLCHEAAISKGSFFQYFPSKSHLLEFTVLVFDDYLAGWMAELRMNERAVLTRDRLRSLYQALAVDSRLSREEERFYLFITNAMDHSAVKLEGIDIERHFSGYVTEIIARGEQTGEIRGDFDVELTGRLTALVIGTLVEGQYAGQRLPPRDMEEYLISFLFDGIKA